MFGCLPRLPLPPKVALQNHPDPNPSRTGVQISCISTRNFDPNPFLMEMLLLFLLLAAVIALLVITLIRGGSTTATTAAIQSALQPWFEQVRNLELGMKEEFRMNREEVGQRLESLTTRTDEKLRLLEEQVRKDQGENRKEINEAFDGFKMAFEKSVTSFNDVQKEKFGDLLRQQLEFAKTTELRMEAIRGSVEEKLGQLTERAKKDASELRESLQQRFREFGEDFSRNVEAFKVLQKEKFEALDKRHQELTQMTEKRLESMRVTVEEKLDKTLSERLGQSFEKVGKQLAEVQTGLGEMKALATDVGGLKKVLSNVKLRGGIGEVQLAMLLEQILAPGQYEADVRIKQDSGDVVEFAIKLPGRSEDEQDVVYLPIDAKFPKEAFEKLVEAYEGGTPEDIDREGRGFTQVIRKMAKDISDKYIHPPVSTDFAIMFLPFESIYAEVIRSSSLVDQLRDNYRVIVAGPTTLAALLNSLQMGFRTLAIQKRSSEVWKILGAVKTEFEKFGGMLQKAQKNIQTGLGQLDDVMGPRTRAIQRKLKDVAALPAAEAGPLLAAALPDTEPNEFTDED